jgi:hypothetical protein
MKKSTIVSWNSERTFHLQHWGKGVEEPSVTVDLLLILFLETEDYLGRYYTLVWILEVQIGINCKRGGILEQMCRNFLSVDTPLHMVSWLINAQKSQTVKYPAMYLLPPIGYYTDNNLS